MSTLILAALIALVVWIAWCWFIARNRPVLPPLAIDVNDPLMIEARQQAKDSIPQMLDLFSEAKDSNAM